MQGKKACGSSFSKEVLSKCNARPEPVQSDASSKSCVRRAETGGCGTWRVVTARCPCRPTGPRLGATGRDSRLELVPGFRGAEGLIRSFGRDGQEEARLAIVCCRA